MICLFDRYDQASFDLLRSLKATGLDCPVVVVQDDGYLSPDVSLLTVILQEIWTHQRAVNLF